VDHLTGVGSKLLFSDAVSYCICIRLVYKLIGRNLYYIQVALHTWCIYKVQSLYDSYVAEVETGAGHIVSVM